MPGPATVLQLASRTCVFILDLLAMSVSCPAKLATTVAQLLQDKAILKVGYGFAHADLPRLAALHAAPVSRSRADSLARESVVSSVVRRVRAAMVLVAVRR